MLSVGPMPGRAGTDILIRPFLQVRDGIHHAAAKLSIPRPGAVKAVFFHRSRREAKETRSLGRTQISEWWSFRSHRQHPSDKRRIGAPDSTHVHSRHIQMVALRLISVVQRPVDGSPKTVVAPTGWPRSTLSTFRGPCTRGLDRISRTCPDDRDEPLPPSRGSAFASPRPSFHRHKRSGLQPGRLSFRAQHDTSRPPFPAIPPTRFKARRAPRKTKSSTPGTTPC